MPPFLLVPYLFSLVVSHHAHEQAMIDGDQDFKKGNYNSAAKAYELVLTTARRNGDPTGLTLTVLERIARAKLAVTLADSAYVSVNEGLKLNAKNKGDESTSMSGFMVLSGIRFMQRGELSNARLFLGRAERIQATLPEPDLDVTVEAAVYLAELDLRQGKKRSARSRLEQIREKTKDRPLREDTTLLFQVCLLRSLTALGDYVQADKVSAECAILARKTFGVRSARYTEYLCEAANLFLKSGRAEQSRALLWTGLRESLALEEPGVQLPRLLLMFGESFFKMGQIQDAAKAASDAKELFSQLGEQNNAFVAECAWLQARIAVTENRKEDALVRVCECLTLYEPNYRDIDTLLESLEKYKELSQQVKRNPLDERLSQRLEELKRITTRENDVR